MFVCVWNIILGVYCLTLVLDAILICQWFTRRGAFFLLWLKTNSFSIIAKWLMRVEVRSMLRYSHGSNGMSRRQIALNDIICTHWIDLHGLMFKQPFHLKPQPHNTNTHERARKCEKIRPRACGMCEHWCDSKEKKSICFSNHSLHVNTSTIDEWEHKKVHKRK